MDPFLLLGLLLVGYASWTDWWTTEVPDWLTYGGLTLALVGRGAFALLERNADIFLTGLIGFGIMWVIGITLYYTAQWGGGDAKLLWALGATLGISPVLDHDLIAFLMNLLVMGGLYGFAYTAVLGVMHFSKTKKSIITLSKQNGVSQMKLYSYGGSLLIVVGAFFAQGLLKTMLLPLAVLLPISFYLWIWTKSVEDVAMVKKIHPKKLMEGDWVLDTVTYKGKTIVTPKTPGLSKEQIAQLCDLKKKNIIKSVTLKQGIPFVPAFLFAYVAMMYLGNIFIWLFILLIEFLGFICSILAIILYSMSLYPYMSYKQLRS